MTREKIRTKKVPLSLKSSTIYNSAGKFVGGGILNSTRHVDSEIWVEVMDDPVLDRATDEEGVTGRLQIHLGGTRRALKELGTFLLSLAYYSPPKPGYSASFEFTKPDGEPVVHLIVHLPVRNPGERPTFLQIHTGATAIVRKDGKIYETTLPALPKRGKG